MYFFTLSLSPYLIKYGIDTAGLGAIFCRLSSSSFSFPDRAYAPRIHAQAYYGNYQKNNVPNNIMPVHECNIRKSFLSVLCKIRDTEIVSSNLGGENN